MESKHEENLLLLSEEEQLLRIARVNKYMAEAELDYILVGDNVNLYYLSGRVFCGYILVCSDGNADYFLRRPSTLKADGAVVYRKLEDMTNAVAEIIKKKPGRLGMMLDDTPYGVIQRLLKGLGGDIQPGNGSAVFRKARAVKTDLEIQQMEMSGIKQTQVYRKIPHLYREGMTDIEFQIEIERALRLEGSLWQFRCSGAEMEIYMGNVLTGENADTPSPYDFAMGGAGMSPSLPVGANGTIIKPGKPVMVDMNGNFTGYMTDMTRCYVAGNPDEVVVKANQLSIDICRRLSEMMLPGVEAKVLYQIAEEMVKEAGMECYFMGHSHQAGFVGHGVGITINELPVIAPRSRDILNVGNCIALEPKFVIPGQGAVGVENTYVVQAQGPARRLTNAPEDIQSLT